MAFVEVLAERETGSGWEFDMQVMNARGELERSTVRMGWADYNLWSPSGSDEPWKVAEAVVEFWIERSADEALPKSFDASLLRRKWGDADIEVPKRIGRG
ncbi:MAG TPA: hypothetical protein VG711_06520 [Phycisphaerales bacterium]|nr:hypothetical protein [Phycisphaerales bacterium]